MNLTNRIQGSRQAAIILAFAALALAFPSCDSDLLSMPPAADNVTLEAAPSETPTSNSITLTYSTDQPVIVTVEYGTVSGTYTNATPRTTVPATAHSTEIVGLSPSTDYFYRIVSYLDGARAFPSEEFTFQTLVDPAFLQIATGPTVTPALTGLDIDFTSNSACTSLVEYGTVPGAYTASTVQTTTPSTSHSVNLAGLATATTYYYRIKMFWDSGDDFISGEFSAATSTEPAPTAAQKARGIWLLGGLSTNVIGSTIAEVDLYDPVTNAWYPAVTSIPVPVSFAGYAAYDGRLFVIGGFDSAGTTQSLVQIYDIAADSWSNGAALTNPRANINASIIYGRISIMGGTAGAYNAGWAQANTYYEYSIGGDSWATRLAVAGSERFTYTFDNAVYYVGGRSAAATTTNTHEGIVYTTNTVTTGTEVVLPVGLVRTGLAGAVVQATNGPSCLVLIGGITGFTGTPTCFINNGPSAGAFVGTVQYIAYPFTLPSAWLPATPTTPPNYPGSIAFGAAVTSTAFSPARIYHFGGTAALGGSAAGQTTAYWISPPSTLATWSASWTGTAAMSRARWGHGAVTLNE